MQKVTNYTQWNEMSSKSKILHRKYYIEHTFTLNDHNFGDSMKYVISNEQIMIKNVYNENH